MKKIGFDVSDTITKYPVQCKELIDSLYRDFWQIFVISNNPINSIYEDLKNSNIDVNKVEIINTEDKHVACKEKGISVFLDDLDKFLIPALNESPDTMVLKVMRKDLIKEGG